jgi:NADH-quinone oxidoreductase subunit A
MYENIVQTYACCVYFRCVSSFSFVEHLKLPAYMFIVTLIILLLFLLCYILAPINSYKEKASAYECGFEPYSDSKGTFDVHYVVLALLFVVFDVELLIILPGVKVLFFISCYEFIVVSIFILLLVLTVLIE